MTVQILQSQTDQAAKKLQSFPISTKIRIISHYDADGISAAGILSKTVHRRGYNFHTTLMRNPFTKGFERLQQEENELIIFSDMGSGQIEHIEQLNTPAIILDHHQFQRKETNTNIIQINANQCGIDGNYEACGASLSYMFATAVHKENEDLAPLALSGIIGDKQHIGGIKGLNKTIVDQAIQNKYVTVRTGVKLSGVTLDEALHYAVDPFYKGLSGRKNVINEALKKQNIDPQSSPNIVDEQQKTQLHSYLFFVLMKAGVKKNILDTVIRERYYAESLGYECERFADLLDACGKNGQRSLGLAVALGDKQAISQAETVEKDYKQHILDALITLENKGAQQTSSFRYFYSENSSLGGVIGGIAMNFLFDDTKPLFSLAIKSDELHVSCRGTQHLVRQGLDLGSAMKQVTKTLGGHGGGHKIAAGATVKKDQEHAFLEQTDAIIKSQLKELR